MKAKRQDKLRPKAIPCFLFGPSANHLGGTFEVLLNSGSVVHSRNVTWAWLPPSVPDPAENVRSVSVPRKGGKLDPSRHEVVEVDEDVDCDESSESTDVRSRVTARPVSPTLAAVPCGRFAPAGGRGTAMKEIPATSVHSSAGTPGGFAMSTPPATSAGVNGSGGTVSPGASVESSPSVSEEDEVDDSPSPELGGRATREMRWLAETSVFGRGGLTESKGSLIWMWRSFLLKKRLRVGSSRNGCRCLSHMTVLPELLRP